MVNKISIYINEKFLDEVSREMDVAFPYLNSRSAKVSSALSEWLDQRRDERDTQRQVVYSI